MLGAVLGAAIPFVIYFVRHDAIGLGDLKLLGCIGLLTGFPSILFIILRAMIFGAVFSIGLLVSKKRNNENGITFCTFCIIGSVDLKHFEKIVRGELWNFWNMCSRNIKQ